jgi:hypothetical protein
MPVQPTQVACICVVAGSKLASLLILETRHHEQLWKGGRWQWGGTGREDELVFAVAAPAVVSVCVTRGRLLELALHHLIFMWLRRVENPERARLAVQEGAILNKTQSGMYVNAFGGGSQQKLDFPDLISCPPILPRWRPRHASPPKRSSMHMIPQALLVQ